MYPKSDVMGRASHPLVFFPKAYNPSIIMRKISGKPKLRTILKNTQPVPFKTVEVMKIKATRSNFNKISSSLF